MHTLFFSLWFPRSTQMHESRVMNNVKNLRWHVFWYIASWVLPYPEVMLLANKMAPLCCSILRKSQYFGIRSMCYLPFVFVGLYRRVHTVHSVYFPVHLELPFLMPGSPKPPGKNNVICMTPGAPVVRWYRGFISRPLTTLHVLSLSSNPINVLLLYGGSCFKTLRVSTTITRDRRAKGKVASDER